MKHLIEFFNYIKESKGIDRPEIESLLLPIVDMGLTIRYYDGTIMCDDNTNKLHGREYLKATIDITRLNHVDITIDGYKSKKIDDDRMWEILDEIISFRGRLLSDGIENCLVDFIIRDSYSAISIIIVGEKEESSDSFTLSELRSTLRSRLNDMKTDFSYSTVVSLDNDNGEYSIEIKTDLYCYTDRKLNNLFRGIDMSRFNVKKYIGSNVINRITIKK